MSENSKILTKIKNLLTLAEDGNNDEESQTALLMAQKLMLKYKISQDELSDTGVQKIIIKSLSVYKRLYWWEKVLVQIIADNFRVLFYIQSNRLPHQNSVRRKLVLMGYPEDVELAYEVFHLAAEAMKFYSTKYIEDTTDSNESPATLRKSYYRGFLDGLDEKYKKQREEMIAENEKYAMIIQTPSDVKEKFEQDVNGHLAFKLDEANVQSDSYLQGFDRGQSISLDTKHIE
ncbi:DUF2786 domain-containing protein [Aerococcaceae bacterium DSM 111176]|nr:DUF2786 domain-containing protein [Aerococcaceae bacterium DSM 111176]